MTELNIWSWFRVKKSHISHAATNHLLEFITESSFNTTIQIASQLMSLEKKHFCLKWLLCGSTTVWSLKSVPRLTRCTKSESKLVHVQQHSPWMPGRRHVFTDVALNCKIACVCYGIFAGASKKNTKTKVQLCELRRINVLHKHKKSRFYTQKCLRKPELQPQLESILNW
jgi:hypothetical protein